MIHCYYVKDKVSFVDLAWEETASGSQDQAGAWAAPVKGELSTLRNVEVYSSLL